MIPPAASTAINVRILNLLFVVLTFAGCELSKPTDLQFKEAATFYGCNDDGEG
jgi:hypothetical protein